MKSASVLITIFLLVLLGVVIATDVEDGWFGAGDDTTLVATAPRDGPLQAFPATGNSERCLSEADLRRIVREELAAYPAATTAARTPDNPGGDAGRPGAPPGSREFERIDRQVDEYIQVGAISEAEMAALQDQMSRLDPAARREILKKIVQAMNSGALAGNL